MGGHAPEAIACTWAVRPGGGETWLIPRAKRWYPTPSVNSKWGKRGRGLIQPDISSQPVRKIITLLGGRKIINTGEEQAQFSNPAWPLGTEIFTDTWTWHRASFRQSFRLLYSREAPSRRQAVLNLFWHESLLPLLLSTAKQNQFGSRAKTVSSYCKEKNQRQQYSLGQSNGREFGPSMAQGDRQ